MKLTSKLSSNSLFILALANIYIKSSINIVRTYFYQILFLLIVLYFLVNKFIIFFTNIRNPFEKEVFQFIILFGLFSLFKNIYVFFKKDNTFLCKLGNSNQIACVKTIKLLVASFSFLVVFSLLRLDEIAFKRPLVALTIGIIALLFGRYKLNRKKINLDFLWRMRIINSSNMVSGIKLILNTVNSNYLFPLVVSQIFFLIISIYLSAFYKESITIVYGLINSLIYTTYILSVKDSIGRDGRFIDSSWIKKNVLGEFSIFSFFYIIQYIFTIILDFMVFGTLQILPVFLAFLISLYVFIVSLILKFLFPGRYFIQTVLLIANIVFPPLSIYYINKGIKE